MDARGPAEGHSQRPRHRCLTGAGDRADGWGTDEWSRTLQVKDATRNDPLLYWPPKATSVQLVRSCSSCCTWNVGRPPNLDAFGSPQLPNEVRVSLRAKGTLRSRLPVNSFAWTTCSPASEQRVGGRLVGAIN
uniref:Uncharacterized protein n=1 Tax=Trichuris muris TaxID=70415 RepID=A0A5S6QDJ9_TRIMR